MVSCVARAEENQCEWAQFSKVQEISIFSCVLSDFSR